MSADPISTRAEALTGSGQVPHEQQSLQEANERLRFILDHILEASFVLDPQGRFQEINLAAASMLQRTREELLGRNIWEAFPNAVGLEFYQQYHKALAEDTPVHFQAQSQSNKGWFEVHAYPREGWLEVFFRDITEKKLADEQIENVAKFPEQNPNPVLRIAVSGELLYANQAAKNLLERLGWKDTNLAPPALFQPARQALSTEITRGLELDDGQRVFTFAVAPIVEDGYANCYGIDITERKRLEDRLAYQAMVLDNVHDAVIAFDPEFTITSWNHAAELLYGYTQAEAFGQVLGELLHSEFSDEARRQAKGILNETGHYHAEMVQYSKDGKRLVIESDVIPIRDKAGQVVGYVTANRDITARKEAEDALKESEQRLRFALEAAGMVAWEFDVETRGIYMSENAPALTGKVLKSKAEVEALVYSEDRELIDRAYMTGCSSEMP